MITMSRPQGDNASLVAVEIENLSTNFTPGSIS